MTQTAPQKDRLQIFVSYSRRNAAIADGIVAALEHEGFAARLDKRDLPFGEEWQKEIESFIRSADTVVWLVSEDSVNSEWCNWELDQCVRQSKRVVPVRIAPIAAEQLPPGLRKLHLLPAEGVFSENADLAKLKATLNTDWAWVREATRFADRAYQWLQKGRPNGLLLSRSALRDADAWLARRQPTAPETARETLDYIQASRRRAGQMQRLAIGGSLAVAAVAGALAVTALFQRQAAVAQRDATLVNQSRLLADAAHQAIEGGDAATGILLALSGLPDDEEGAGRPDVVETQNMLLSGLLNLRERRTFDGTSGAQLSSDGARLASMMEDVTSVQVVDFATGNPIAVLTHPSYVWSFSMSADATRVVTRADDKKIRVWNVAEARVLIELNNEDGVDSVSLSPDGAKLLITKGSGAMVWDIATFKRLLLLTHPEEIKVAAYSPDGSRIATAAKDGKIRLFDTATGETLNVFDYDTETLAFAGNGSALLALDGARNSDSVRVWRLPEGTERTTIHVPTGGLRQAAFDPAVTRIVTTDFDNYIRVFDLEKGYELTKMKGQVKLINRGVAVADVSVAFIDNGKKILSTHHDDTVRVWDVDPPSPAKLDAGCVAAKVRVAASGAAAATVCQTEGEIAVWSGAGNELLFKHAIPGGQAADVLFDPAGSTLAVLGKSGAVSLIGLPGRAELQAFEQGSEIASAAFDPSGSRLAVGSVDGVTKIWKRDASGTWDPTPLVLAPAGPRIAAVTFSAAGDRVATVSGDRTARIWDAASGRLLHTLAINDADPSLSLQADGTMGDSPSDIAFSPDGVYLATEKSGRTYIWNAETGARLASTRTTNGTPIHRLAFSDDGRRLISGGIEWATWIGEVPTGRTLRYVDTSTYDPFAYQPKGELLVISDYQGVQINDAGTGRRIAMLGESGSSPTSVDITADGTKVYGVDTGGGVETWQLPLRGPERVAAARRAVPRCLTTLQLESAGLDPAPPRWCITGPDHVADRDPASWDGKWPYRSEAWRTWLAARDRGETPELPNLPGGGPPPPRPDDALPGAVAGTAPGNTGSTGAPSNGSLGETLFDHLFDPKPGRDAPPAAGDDVPHGRMYGR